jgi:hypothetical protein
MPETKFFLRRPLPYRKNWQKEMARQRGKVEANLFMGRVQSKYLELFARSATYRPRVLQKQHFEKNILPAIAAYQVLLEEVHLPGPALKSLDSLLAATIAGQKRLYKFGENSHSFSIYSS